MPDQRKTGSVSRWIWTGHSYDLDAPRSMTAFNLSYDREEAARYPHVARLTGAPPRDWPPLAGEDEIGPAATELWLQRKRSRP